MDAFKILIVEDNPGHADLIVRAFKNHQNLEIVLVENVNDAKNAIEHNDVDLIISDWVLPDGKGLEVFSLENEQNPTLPFILLTSQGNEELAVKALKNGAMDYVVKSKQSFENLPAIAVRAWREWQNIQRARDTEQKLIESEQKYRLITETINDVVWLVDLDLTYFKYVSPSVKGFLGYESDELVNQTISKTFAGHSLAKIAFLRQKIREQVFSNTDNLGSFKIDIELEFLHKDGSSRWGDLKGSFMMEKGQLSSIHGITRDITEKRIAEKRLRIQEAYFETLIHEAPVAIAILDNSDRVMQINRQFVHLFGYTPQEARKRQINDLIVPQKLKAEGALSTSQVAEGKNVMFESVRQSKTGELIDVLILGKPVFFGQDQIAVFGLYQDISEQKKTQKKLQQLSERLVLATSTVGIGIWDYDIECKSLVWEPEMYNLYNVEKKKYDNLLDLWKSLIHRDDRNKLQDLFEKQSKKSSAVKEGIYKLKNGGKSKHIKFLASFINDDNGKPVRLVGVCWDNTQEIEHAELEKKFEISTRVSKIKQQFLANMSHEIRSPMTGILGMTELVLKTSLDEKQKKYLETIKASSDSLLNIVNDILDLSKIEAGKMEVRPVLFNLRKSGEKIYNLFSAIASQKGLEFTLEYDPRLPDSIYADEHRIEQIVTNLVSNAIKFTGSGFVKMKYNMLEYLENEIDIGIDVVDSGIGISKENQLKLFDIFSQVDTSDTRTFEGAGLGLSISQRLAELLGGNIGVESELRKGSRFWFRFFGRQISKDEEANIQTYEDFDTAPKLGFNVLLVEDKKTNQMVVSLMLEEAKCTTEVASNGFEALKMFIPGKYDFILMDIQMPVMDGVTAVKRLRKDFAPEELPPIIGLSAKAMEGDAEFYISEGMDDYLTKPLSSHVLYRKLIALAQKNRKKTKKK